MYRVYADDLCIYNDLATEQEVRLVAPTVEWADNSTGTFTFTIPTVNVGYEALTLMQSKIKIFRNDELIWVGRPIKETKDFWKNRQITCEGAMGYLNDVIQPQRDLSDAEFVNVFHGYPAEYLQIILDYHNRVMHENGLDDRRIFMGRVTVTDMMKSDDPDEEYYNPDTKEPVADYVPTIYIDNKSTMECISEKLTGGKNVKGEDLEGHLRFRIESDAFYLDYLKDPIEENPQIIEFGKNLLDFTVNYDESDFCTVLYPRGASEGQEVGNMSKHIELMDYQNGDYTKSDMVFHVTAPKLFYPAGVQQFGYIERTLDISDEQDETVLLDKAMEWFTKNRFNDMELNLKAFDLTYLGMGEQFLRYMDSVHVRSIPHGLDKDFPVLGVSIPLDQPQNASYTLGKKKVQSLSAQSSQVSKDIKETQEYTISKTNEVYHKSETLIRNATTGVVNTMMNQYGAEAMVIVDLDKNDPDDQEILEKIHDGTITVEDLGDRHMWVWNLGGLAYFEHGLNEDFKVAIDMEGKINCDFLKGGTIEGQKIKGGTIEGAQFTSKSSSQTMTLDNSSLEIKDSNHFNKYVIFNVDGDDGRIISYNENIVLGANYGYIQLNSATASGHIILNTGSRNENYIGLQTANAYLGTPRNDAHRILTKSEIQSMIDSSSGGGESGDYVTQDDLELALNLAKLWVTENFVQK